MAFGPLEIGDGGQLWRIARDSGALDLNTPYSYLLWCRDFAATSAAARARADHGPGPVVGFATGYLRPQAPDTLFVWQIAVDAGQRGRGVAAGMLRHLAQRLVPAGVTFVEATVTPDNEPSARLFAAFAREMGAGLARRDLFGSERFPTPHQPEALLRIGPLPRLPPAGPRRAADPSRPHTAAPASP